MKYISDFLNNLNEIFKKSSYVIFIYDAEYPYFFLQSFKKHIYSKYKLNECRNTENISLFQNGSLSFYNTNISEKLIVIDINNTNNHILKGGLICSLKKCLIIITIHSSFAKKMNLPDCNLFTVNSKMLRWKYNF